MGKLNNSSELLNEFASRNKIQFQYVFIQRYNKRKLNLKIEFSLICDPTEVQNVIVLCETVSLRVNESSVVHFI